MKFLLLLLGLVLFLPARAQRQPDVARSVTIALGAQGRILWVDGTANLFRAVTANGQTRLVDYTTTREGVRDIVRKCKAAHINTLVVDVKPLSGEVLYNSKVAPRLRQWKGHPVPDFDVLAAFVEEGHKAGLQVDACINVLSEGHKYYKVGLAYQHPDWQSIVYTVDRGLVAPDGQRLAMRVSGEPDDPTKPEILPEDASLLSGDPNSGLVGLEKNTGSDRAKPQENLGQQLNVVLDADDRVTGMVDSALLGDDPLIVPENGRILSAVRESDRNWMTRHLKTGSQARFDLKTGRTPITQAPSEKVSCFVNPLHPDARAHELAIVRELVSNYALDGLVLDRCRFSNLNNDFSDRTRDAFTQWLKKQETEKVSRRDAETQREGKGESGKAKEDSIPEHLNTRIPAPIQNPKSKIQNPVFRWPQDIFAFNNEPGEEPVRGPLFKAWLEFRAQTIRDFVGEIAQCARSLKPNITLGTYVGSWYPRYYEVGVNWGSEKTHLRYDWFSPAYPGTGYAEFFDWISTGCYYPTPTIEAARQAGLSEKATVEYAAGLSTWAVAGGAFVYPGVEVSDYEKPETFLAALDAAENRGQGWMVFDLSHLDELGWWPQFTRAAAKETTPPERVPGLLSLIREAMDAAQ